MNDWMNGMAKEHICKICKESFKTGSSLGAHVTLKHRNSGFQKGHKRFTKDRKGKTLEEIFNAEIAQKMRKSLSLAHSNKHPWNYGLRGIPLPHTKEWNENISKSLMGRDLGPEVYKKISISNKKYFKNHPEAIVFLRENRLKIKIPKVSSIEIKLFKGLQKMGYNPVSQYPFQITLIDVAFPEKKIAIYADGDYWHNLPGYQERDSKINEFLKENGWTVLRFWEHEVNDNLEVCINKIVEEMI